MKAIVGIMALVAFAACVAGAGLLTDYYPSETGIVVARGGSTVWGIRVTNDYDCQMINVTIENIKDMEIMDMMNQQTVFQIPAGFKQEILFRIIIPANSTRTSWQPTFLIREVKAEGADTFIDTAISPKGVVYVNVGAETLYNGVQGWQNKNLQPYKNTNLHFNGTCATLEGQPTPMPTPIPPAGSSQTPTPTPKPPSALVITNPNNSGILASPYLIPIVLTAFVIIAAGILIARRKSSEPEAVKAETETATKKKSPYLKWSL